MLKIIVDTREDKPLDFLNHLGEVQIYHDNLKAGDYTLVGADLPGDDYSVIIERKESCREFLRNLVAEWDRFERELALLSRYNTAQIVVCEPDRFDWLYAQDMTKCHPSILYSRIAYAKLHYGVSCIFLKDRVAAENYIFRMFNHVDRAIKQDAIYT